MEKNKAAVYDSLVTAIKDELESHERMIAKRVEFYTNNPERIFGEIFAHKMACIVMMEKDLEELAQRLLDELEPLKRAKREQELANARR